MNYPPLTNIWSYSTTRKRPCQCTVFTPLGAGRADWESLDYLTPPLALASFLSFGA